MKNLKVNWTAVLAIALACTIVSCENEKRESEYREQQGNEYTTRIEQAIDEFKEKDFLTEVDEIIYPEEQESEEKGFSR